MMVVVLNVTLCHVCQVGRRLGCDGGAHKARDAYQIIGGLSHIWLSDRKELKQPTPDDLIYVMCVPRDFGHSALQDRTLLLEQPLDSRWLLWKAQHLCEMTEAQTIAISERGRNGRI